MYLTNIRARLQYTFNMHLQIEYPLSKMFENRSILYPDRFIFVFWNIYVFIIRHLEMKLSLKQKLIYISYIPCRYGMEVIL